MKKPFFWILLLIIVVFSGSIGAEDIIKLDFSGPVNEDGVPGGWKLKERKGRAVFRVTEEEGSPVLYVKSERASFSFERRLNISPYTYPVIKWKWKVIKLPEGADLRQKDKNDQAAQVLVLFEGKKTISYVWDTSAPANTVTDESIGWPINIKIKVIVVRSGNKDLKKWVTIERNLLEDYRRLYGQEPGNIRGIRIQINTQHTGTTAEAAFSSIFFLPVPTAPEF